VADHAPRVIKVNFSPPSAGRITAIFIGALIGVLLIAALLEAKPFSSWLAGVRHRRARFPDQAISSSQPAPPASFAINGLMRCRRKWCVTSSHHYPIFG
jgi:hypothetical protein